MLTTLIFAISIIVQVDSCEPNCASCRNLSPFDYYCLACSPGNELVSIYNICIQDNTISNCAYYLQTLDCKFCKPTYSRQSNVCNKMYDGCLISQMAAQGRGCSVCLPGSYINNQTGTCVIKYLNCANISDQGQCTVCYPQYTLKGGKCVYNGSSCSSINPDTGLCSACTTGRNLIGYSCVGNSQANATANCYLVNRGINTTCTYCKVGYAIIFGSCIPFRDLIASLKITDQNCSQIQYITDNTVACLAVYVNSSSSFNGDNCLVGDFGFKRCLICSSGYSLNSQNQCMPTLDLFCSSFDANRTQCTLCKKKFYLLNGRCYPFPNFCKTYNNSTGCVQCESSFQLVNGHCTDPNCQTVNSITGICQICTINYQLNSQNICKYIDANCRKTGVMGNCLQCFTSYTLKSNGLCGFKDLNCLTTDPNNPAICILCSPGFFYNSQLQICILLPQYCLTLDLSGRCNQCNPMYVLTSGYQCIFLAKRVPNCKMVNQADYTKCSMCIDGFFADNGGVCQTLPLFCLQFDANTNTCVQCNSNGVMKNGICVDKNCLIFDTEGSCLACLPNYVFGNFGQCYLELKDPNCKQYQFNICKLCSQRYYFNFQFTCTPVSPLCNTYDTNSGVCTSCYSGYQLTASGDCSMVTMNSLYYSSDLLMDSSCKRVNNRNQCLQCFSDYTAVPIMIGNVSVLNCVKKIVDNSYCVTSDKNGSCVECVARMYLDQTGTCSSVDVNCQEYSNKTGVCKVCYQGYNITYDSTTNKTSCIIINDIDPNCQTKGNASLCLKCYQGYYFSVQNLVCQQVDPHCASYNQTNGNCLTCYVGYKLKGSKCVLQGKSDHEKTNGTSKNTSIINTTNKIIANQTKSNYNTTSDVVNGQSTKQSNPNCIKSDGQTKLCTVCQWGYALINGICYQQDLNCNTFQNANSLKCLQCYPGYKPFSLNQTQSLNQTRCIIQTLIVQNCLKYDQAINCILCDNGFVLSPSSTGHLPNFICTVIDQNCLIYNTTLNMCQLCNMGTVLEGRICVMPLYGLDPNCVLYQGGVCIKCKEEWTLNGYLCSNGK